MVLVIVVCTDVLSVSEFALFSFSLTNTENLLLVIVKGIVFIFDFDF